MNQDVKQWLTEIKLLQQKVADAQQEREEAYASAANWRNLYETEAKQRRTEVNLAQQTITALTAKLHELQMLPGAEAQPDILETLQAEVEPLQGVEELKGFLVKALAECDRLTRALQAEQAAHAQTRTELTSALGDTMALLSKARSEGQLNGAASATNGRITEGKGDRSTNPSNHPADPSNHLDAKGASPSLLAKPSEVKAPSLELPRLDQAQYPS